MLVRCGSVWFGSVQFGSVAFGGQRKGKKNIRGARQRILLLKQEHLLAGLAGFGGVRRGSAGFGSRKKGAENKKLCVVFFWWSGLVQLGSVWFGSVRFISRAEDARWPAWWPRREGPPGCAVVTQSTDFVV